MQADYNNLEKMAGQKEEKNWEFRKFLKFFDELSEDEIDKLVSKLADKYESQIECTDCGRCCRKLKPTVSEIDQLRLSDALGMSVEKLKDNYLEFDNDEDEPGWQIKSAPCPFLENNKCSIYENRPDDCRGYPYLHEDGFNRRTMGMIERTFTCPIVYNVMEELKDKLAFDADDFGYDCW